MESNDREIDGNQVSHQIEWAGNLHALDLLNDSSYYYFQEQVPVFLNVLRINYRACMQRS